MSELGTDLGILGVKTGAQLRAFRKSCKVRRDKRRHIFKIQTKKSLQRNLKMIKEVGRRCREAISESGGRGTPSFNSRQGMANSAGLD